MMLTASIPRALGNLCVLCTPVVMDQEAMALHITPRSFLVADYRE